MPKIVYKGKLRMAYTLNGFIKIKPKINNAVGIISPIGELSTFSQTFTKELAEFENPSHADVVFVSFKSETDASVVPPNTIYTDHILQVSQYVYQFCRDFVGNISKLDIMNQIMTIYQGTIAGMVIGDLVSSGGLTMPEWLSWSNALLPTNSLKVWYSDPAIRRQYMDYSITVVPPIENIDDFFKHINDIKDALSQRNGSVTAQLIQEAKNGHPETVYRVEDYVLHSTVSPEYRPLVSWNLLIYGPAGDNSDLVKEAIKEYCLANSTRPLSDWAVIFPDIFKTTEFIMIPLWGNISIPNRTTQVGMFSPIVKKTDIDFVKSLYPTMDQTHLENNLQFIPNNYRSVNIATFGSTENRDAKYKITDYFNDYINVGSNSVDFNRMSMNTQRWALMLGQLLPIAENPDQFTDLPASIKKMTRGNITYIAKSYNNILYMVATKSSVLP